MTVIKFILRIDKGPLAAEGAVATDALPQTGNYEEVFHE